MVIPKNSTRNVFQNLLCCLTLFCKTVQLLRVDPIGSRDFHTELGNVRCLGHFPNFANNSLQQLQNFHISRENKRTGRGNANRILEDSLLRYESHATAHALP